MTSNPTIYNSVTMTPPATVTCTGLATECAVCPLLTEYRVSESSSSLTTDKAVYIETDLATGKLKLFYKANSRLAVKSYVQSVIPHQTVTTVYHDFSVNYNVGKEFVYPDCSPWCLYDPTFSDPLNLVAQE